VIPIKTGVVFNIQKFSINDGPGIRTTVFLKGCPLRCIWCHNPESKSAKPELFFDDSKCVQCRRCGAVCALDCHVFENGQHQYDRAQCAACGKCTQACLADALQLAGTEQTVSEVLDEVMKDLVFYQNSGGGMTVSGGEPMFQFEFTLALLQAAKEQGLHTCMETCGFASAEHYRAVAPYVDIFLFDYKETEPARHKEYTGVDNELILRNLHMLDDMGCNIVLRCPIIPTLNDRSEHFAGIAQTANSLRHVLEINVEPYHPLGSSKAERLDQDYPLKELTFPEETTVSAWMQTIAEQTDVPVKKA